MSNKRWLVDSVVQELHEVQWWPVLRELVQVRKSIRESFSLLSVDDVAGADFQQYSKWCHAGTIRPCPFFVARFLFLSSFWVEWCRGQFMCISVTWFSWPQFFVASWQGGLLWWSTVEHLHFLSLMMSIMPHMWWCLTWTWSIITTTIRSCFFFFLWKDIYFTFFLVWQVLKNRVSVVWILAIVFQADWISQPIWGGKLEIIARRDIKKEEELFASFGPRANDNLFLYYGKNTLRFNKHIFSSHIHLLSS